VDLGVSPYGSAAAGINDRGQVALSAISVSSGQGCLQQVYSDAWERCKLERNGFRRAEQIQVLVAACQILAKADK
jgi:hypothetical protein